MVDQLADIDVKSRKVASSTALLLARRAILTVVSGAAGILVARWLTPTGYGQLQSALVTWTLVVGLTDFGFSLSLARDFAAEPSRAGDRLRAAYRIQGALSLALSAVFVALAVSVGLGTPRGLCLLVLAPSVAFGAFTAGRTYYTAVFDVKVTVRIDIAVTLVQIAAMVLLAVTGAGPVGVAAAVSIGTIVTTAWIGLAARKVAVAEGVRVPAGDIVRPALPLGVVGVMSRIYISADVIILGFLLSGAPVGEYAAAAKLLVLLNTLPGLLMSTALPGFTSAMATPGGLSRMVARIVQWSAVLMLPAFVVFFLYADVVVRVVLGSAFSDAANLARILCLAGVVGLFGQVVGTLLVAHRVVGVMVWQNLIAAVGNVALNVLLVPVYGVVASAWITVGTEVFVVGASYVTMRRRLRLSLPVLRFLGRPAAALLPSVIALVLLRESVLALVVSLVSLPIMYVAVSAWPDDLVPQRWRGTRWTWDAELA